MKSIENLIQELEELYPQGFMPDTGIQRCLLSSSDTPGWCVTTGLFQRPKQIYYGLTLRDVLQKALKEEKKLLKVRASLHK